MKLALALALAPGTWHLEPCIRHKDYYLKILKLKLY